MPFLFCTLQNMKGAVEATTKNNVQVRTYFSPIHWLPNFFLFDWKQTAGVLWRASMPASSWKDARCFGHAWGESIRDDNMCVWRWNPAAIWKPERGISCSINPRAHTKHAFVQTLSPWIPLVVQNVSEWRRLGGKTSQDERDPKLLELCFGLWFFFLNIALWCW